VKTVYGSEKLKPYGKYGSILFVEQKTNSTNFFIKSWRGKVGQFLTAVSGCFMAMNIFDNLPAVNNCARMFNAFSLFPMVLLFVRHELLYLQPGNDAWVEIHLI
jgi:hypothetical protein